MVLIYTIPTSVCEIHLKSQVLYKVHSYNLHTEIEIETE